MCQFKTTGRNGKNGKTIPTVEKKNNQRKEKKSNKINRYIKKNGRKQQREIKKKGGGNSKTEKKYVLLLFFLPVVGEWCVVWFAWHIFLRPHLYSLALPARYRAKRAIARKRKKMIARHIKSTQSASAGSSSPYDTIAW